MRERMFSITTPEEADAFIDSRPIVAIFKAGTCHKTMQGWGNVEKMLRVRPEIPVGIIKVVEHRPASNRVAERTGIVHHSPQIILFRNGQPLFELNNWEITLENLEPLFQQHLPDVKVEPAQEGGKSNLEPYKRLLDAYLSGAVSEQQFAWAYLNMFREDASLRSQEEFELLNSLFGNPDEHHIHPMTILQFEQANPQATPLFERAQHLRARLDTL
ncbi:monothiol bacilliredoxin BrxC family protein [Meiothermus taiwanensis]|uniref:Bacillithiol system protein YtxJ n=2 Tax=Meiothermus taiwanensis TaxID=172827 RepID=A0A399E4W7_9DEIN|nr:monothiol bacilliredoxin BrxC family protein [Meiothermus taiwanensis]KIQ54190.1 thioredoxin [Meiothermus taiwanensis]RIH77780.1 bacillithiol system protein YtxJ [Meiothermus taiwanensis]